jgi:hypothetical protein
VRWGLVLRRISLGNTRFPLVPFGGAWVGLCDDEVVLYYDFLSYLLVLCLRIFEVFYLVLFGR